MNFKNLIKFSPSFHCVQKLQHKHQSSVIKSQKKNKVNLKQPSHAADLEKCRLWLTLLSKAPRVSSAAASGAAGRRIALLRDRPCRAVPVPLGHPGVSPRGSRSVAATKRRSHDATSAELIPRVRQAEREGHRQPSATSVAPLAAVLCRDSAEEWREDAAAWAAGSCREEQLRLPAKATPQPFQLWTQQFWKRAAPEGDWAGSAPAPLEGYPAEPGNAHPHPQLYPSPAQHVPPSLGLFPATMSWIFHPWWTSKSFNDSSWKSRGAKSWAKGDD